jgi:hypothetical protein
MLSVTHMLYPVAVNEDVLLLNLHVQIDRTLLFELFLFVSCGGIIFKKNGIIIKWCVFWDKVNFDISHFTLIPGE